MKRTPISKSFRFAIFARDNFTCRYCGRQSDVVPLHVDHVIPVCQGGTNDRENLITACADCNLGKSGKTIPQSVPTESDRLRLSQERNEQLASANAAAAAAKARQDLRDSLRSYWLTLFGRSDIEPRTEATIVGYIDRHGADIVFSWIDRAATSVRYPTDQNLGKYISGIRRSAIEEGQIDA